MKKGSKKGIVIRSILAALLLIVVVTVNCVAVYWKEPVTQALGVIGADKTEEMGEMYFKSAYSNKEEAKAASLAVIEEVLEEGSVLLKNENNALPIRTENGQKAKVSLFGITSANFIYSGSGSGSANTGDAVNFRTALEESGFEVNPVLWDFYESGAGSEYGNQAASGTVGGLEQSISEVPQSAYTSKEKNSFAEYNDAAIVVLGRSGSEGVDLTRNMRQFDDKRKKGIAAYEEDQHYLELTKEEKDLLKEVAGNFENVIVLLNASNAMELGFVDEEEYGIDAVLWCGAVGQTGTRGVSRVLSGEVNPSGRLTDTYVYDNFSAPAMQNFGDYKYEDNPYFYVTYQESIYVGYKYYETRYEDAVLGQGNAGEYVYDEVVKYPFGYGLSYTDFVWSDFQTEDKGDFYEVTVNVTNQGNTDGKEVVEVYYQAPYKAGGIEKPSVALGGFAKVDVPAGETKTVTMQVDKKDMASYDATEKESYVLEDGSYYITAAKDAHAAINNILEAKGVAVGGDAAFTSVFEQAETIVYENSDNGYKLANRFDDADLTNEACPAYDAEFTYLSRNDWEGTFPTSYSTGDGTEKSNNRSGFMATRAMTDVLLEQLEMRGYDAAGNPQSPDSYTAPAMGKRGKAELIQLMGKEYNDPLWDELLDQMTLEEIVKVIENAGYTTNAMESIAKPKTYDYDGPAGVTSFFTKVDACAFPVEVVIASTWNTELIERVGQAFGEDCLWSNQSPRTRGVNGWYAPAMNIHRTPFGGRNFEYYSEDGFLSGCMGSAQTKGVQSKGIYCYLKHFAVNEQESNRASATGGLGLITWANEQSMREIYLKPFQKSVEENAANGTLAVMTSFNRLGARWAGGSYALITEVLRNEWGFNGLVLTDYWESPYMEAMQMLAAGGDATLISAKNPESKIADTESNMALSKMRDAAKHICYTVVNSSAMNGITYNTSKFNGIPVYVLILVALDLVTAIVIGLHIRAVRKYMRNAKEQKMVLL